MDSRLTPNGGKLGRAMRSPWIWPAAAFSHVVIGCVLVGGVALAIGAVAQVASVSTGGVALGLLVLTATARLRIGVRRGEALIAIGYLEQAVRLNLPLPVMLRAAESAESGGTRRALRQLRTRLEDGLPVGLALGEAASGASTRQLRLIDAAENMGRLGATLGRLVNQGRRGPRRDPSADIFIRWYPLVLTVGVGGVCALLMVKILPIYRGILIDFHRPIPAIMQWLSNWGDTFFVVCAIVVPLVLMIYVDRTTAAIFSARLRRPAILDLLADLLLWRLPVVSGVVRDRGLADICHLLSDAFETGHTPVQALRSAAQLKLNAVLRRRVRRWAERVEAGMPLADAARAARMPRLLVGMLSSAIGEDVPRVLEFLARYYEFRFSRARELLRGAVIPVTVVLFGAAALAMACGLFVPLIDLADALCSKLSQGRL